MKKLTAMKCVAEHPFHRVHGDCWRATRATIDPPTLGRLHDELLNPLVRALKLSTFHRRVHLSTAGEPGLAKRAGLVERIERPERRGE
jgi:hypothetical protein